MPAIRRNENTSSSEFEDASYTTRISGSRKQPARARKSHTPYTFPSVSSDDSLSTGGAQRSKKSQRAGREVSVASSATSRTREGSDMDEDSDVETLAATPPVKGKNGPTFKGPIIVSGVELRPTVAFDTFWYWAAERKAIDDKRRAGLPAPWTKDPILRDHHFCNTFRVLDKGCQFLIKEVIEKGSQDPEEITFRIVLFNLFTRIETWQLLDRRLGPLKWKTYSHDKYAEVLADAEAEGQTLYTHAFFKPAPKFGHPRAYLNHLCFLEVLMDNKLFARLLGAPYMADVFEYLVCFPSYAAFSAYQLMLNLSYSKVLNFHRDDFVVSGPGSQSGLKKIFGKSWQSSDKDLGFHQDVMRYFVDNQDYHFNRLGLRFSGLGPKKLRMDIADVEHALCEVDKYSRAAHPSMKAKRNTLNRKFKTFERPNLPPAVFPKAWKHPARAILKIRPEKELVNEGKRYEIKELKDHMDHDEHGRLYRVSWVGYSSKDDSWEPENMLLDEAPIMVEDYVKQAGISHSPNAQFIPD